MLKRKYKIQEMIHETRMSYASVKFILHQHFDQINTRHENFSSRVANGNKVWEHFLVQIQKTPPAQRFTGQIMLPSIWLQSSKIPREFYTCMPHKIIINERYPFVSNNNPTTSLRRYVALLRLHLSQKIIPRKHIIYIIILTFVYRASLLPGKQLFEHTKHVWFSY